MAAVIVLEAHDVILAEIRPGLHLHDMQGHFPGIFDAVRRAEFHQALTIMAPLQKTIAAKQFEDYTKKLKDIDAIATPHQP